MYLNASASLAPGLLGPPGQIASSTGLSCARCASVKKVRPLETGIGTIAVIALTHSSWMLDVEQPLHPLHHSDVRRDVGVAGVLKDIEHQGVIRIGKILAGRRIELIVLAHGVGLE